MTEEQKYQTQAQEKDPVVTLANQEGGNSDNGDSGGGGAKNGNGTLGGSESKIEQESNQDHHIKFLYFEYRGRAIESIPLIDWLAKVSNSRVP